MVRQIKNLVFEGGGILGISYLGVLDYLYHNDKKKDIVRVAGTSAGAIMACITSFNLPFEEITDIASTLDYKKVPSRTEVDRLKFIPDDMKEMLDELFGDINCIYRMVNNYGWFSTEYFYDWIKGVIEDQFDKKKKLPPYTFADFKNPELHKEKRPFLDLYIIGTDLSMKATTIFSYETTPTMEVAKAVRISMSIPLFFEAVKTDGMDETGKPITNVFCDGGATYNYPLTIFDKLKFNPFLYYGVNMETLGARFTSKLGYAEINNLISYIGSLLQVSSYIQQENYTSNPLNKLRSIVIDTYDINPIDFNINANDEKYKFLYHQGYQAAKIYFS